MKKMDLLLVVAGLLLSLSVFSYEKVIYGDDDRLDIYDVGDSLLLEIAESTAAQVPRTNFEFDGEEVKFKSKTLEARGICKEERFSSQTTAARCSGFLVAPDVLVTAGHCVKSASDCSNNVWIFDYKMDSDTRLADVPKSSVYGCKKIISKSYSYWSKLDYGVVQLDRKVTDRTPLKFRTKGKVESGQRLVVIGHPTGLPTKVAGGAYVRDNSPSDFFVANLDTYGGNSGSAVFDLKTGTVEGILVRGATDYVKHPTKNCQISNKCTNEGCRGEDVTRITRVSGLPK